MKQRGSRGLRRRARAWALLGAAGLFVCAGNAGQHQSQPTGSTSQPGDELLGEWWTEGKEGRIRFARHRDGSFFGTSTCCKPQRDVHNPDPKLRARSTLGIVLIWGLAYRGEGRYEDGYVYNPRDGETYRLDVSVIDRETVRIRGYLGIPLLGQSQLWERAGAPP